MSRMSGRVAIVGHSYVTRLENMIRIDGGRNFKNNLGLSGVNVRFYGRGGGNIQTIAGLMAKMSADGFIPSAVVLQIGGNDLDSTHYNINEFIAELHVALLHLRSVGVASISIMSVFPRLRHRYVSAEVYIRRRAELNCQLSTYCQAHEIWFEHRPMVLRPALLSSDGVHLCRCGMKRYYHEMKFVVLRALSRV